ncbi:response regulator [Paenibacillus wulumuqiensis]|uniref:response regulator n=1 Tax=Paenibacillus wulumuqiensis TaxID=1567107 RepID=UPI000619C148|nr:response regulator [Paenibacillus wulumuqiensis]
MSALLNVMIADDEPIIREGIRDAVDWDSLGMIVAAEAEDGEEALEIALQQDIHILLVDMNMPFMNGIALMKRLREERPGCRFVIITGHDEFSYAQEAIRLGVKDYILKPVDPVHLQEVLNHIRTELNGDQQQEEYLKLATDQIQRNIPLLREQFCLEWLHGRLREEEIRRQQEFLGLPSVHPAALTLIRWSGQAEGRPLLKEQDRQLLLFAIGNIAAELLSDIPLVICREDSGTIILCLWEVPAAHREEQIIAAVRDHIGLHVQVYMQPVIDEEYREGMEWSQQLYATYRQLRQELKGQTGLSPLVRRARGYILQHYADPQLTLEQLAEALQVSPTYLSRVMKKELGQSFIHVLVQARMQRAAQLLQESDRPILEVAEEVGYESQHYFSTAFKKVMGVSPNRYRRDSSSD